MSGLKDLEATIARLDEAHERVREATREANSTTKELRGLIREGREVIKAIEATTELAVEERVGAVIRTSLDEMAVAMNKSLATAADTLTAKLERQTNMALYGNTQGKGRTIFEELTEQAGRAKVTILKVNAKLAETEHRLEGP